MRMELLDILSLIARERLIRNHRPVAFELRIHFVSVVAPHCCPEVAAVFLQVFERQLQTWLGRG